MEKGWRRGRETVEKERRDNLGTFLSSNFFSFFSDMFLLQQTFSNIFKSFPSFEFYFLRSLIILFFLKFVTFYMIIVILFFSSCRDRFHISSLFFSIFLYFDIFVFLFFPFLFLSIFFFVFNACTTFILVFLLLFLLIYILHLL